MVKTFIFSAAIALNLAFEPGYYTNSLQLSANVYPVKSGHTTNTGI